MNKLISLVGLLGICALTSGCYAYAGARAYVSAPVVVVEPASPPPVVVHQPPPVVVVHRPPPPPPCYTCRPNPHPCHHGRGHCR